MFLTTSHVKENSEYGIQDAELFGVCLGIVGILKEGMPVNSPAITAIIKSERERFGTTDLKKAFLVCQELAQKKQDASIADGLKIIDEILPK